MITLSELWRRVQNISVTAKVVETQSSSGKALVKVLYTDRDSGENHISSWLPVLMKNNSLMKLWFPVLVGEQVTVVRPFGDNDGGLVIPSVFWKGNKETVGANEHAAIVEFSDGCVIKYDTKTGRLSVNGTKSIKLVATETVSVVAKDIKLYSATLTHNGVNVGYTHRHPTCIKCGATA